MDNKKYYIPKIEEFHIGFEYEAKVYGEDYYLPLVFKPNDYETLFDKRILSISGQQVYEEPRFYVPDTFRVKYLDREDIEELGWYYSSIFYESNEFRFKCGCDDEDKKWFELEWDEADGNVRIFYSSLYNWFCVFRGFVKNKSELRRVMEMVGIETE
jgi:hypothetical protein